MHCLMSNLPVTVHLISQTPYFYIVRIFHSMFDTQITVFRSARMVAVFQKIAGICYSSCTKINSHHHICICFFQPFGKFIQTNFILFKTSPCKFQTNRTFLYRSHTIFPEKVRYKVSSWISYDRNI